MTSLYTSVIMFWESGFDGYLIETIMIKYVCMYMFKWSFSRSHLRSTRKIKKKRHKYGEDDAVDDFGAALSEVEEGSRSATPVKGPNANKVAKRLLQTPASAAKKSK